MIDTELCKRLEHFETPEWAAREILEKEILTRIVLDPCVGAGVLAESAKRIGYEVVSLDIHDWGYPLDKKINFLEIDDSWELPSSCDFELSILMNPPFSLATQFVEKAFFLKARKIICFQRFAWYESRVRREFWDKYPPNRVYICGDRANCWRHDIPLDQRGSGTTTAHAWFVWDRDAPAGTILGRIYKDGG
jgi:predicted RNA methylase